VGELVYHQTAWANTFFKAIDFFKDQTRNLCAHRWHGAHDNRTTKQSCNPRDRQLKSLLMLIICHGNTVLDKEIQNGLCMAPCSYKIRTTARKQAWQVIIETVKG